MAVTSSSKSYKSNLYLEPSDLTLFHLKKTLHILRATKVTLRSWGDSLIIRRGKNLTAPPSQTLLIYINIHIKCLVVLGRKWSTFVWQLSSAWASRPKAEHLSWRWTAASVLDPSFLWDLDCVKRHMCSVCVRARACVRVYLLHIEHQNPHCICKMRTFLASGDILAGLHNFKGVLKLGF